MSTARVLPFAALKELPSAIEAEQALLGACMSNNAALPLVSFLEPAHFEEPLHGALFAAMRALEAEGRPFNPVTLRHHIAGDIKIGHMTPSEYMAMLMAESTTVLNAPDYGKAVLDTYALRKLVSIGEDLSQLARGAQVDGPAKVLVEADAMLAEVQDALALKQTGVTFSDAVDMAARATSDAFKFKKRTGLSTGIDAVEQLTGPWEAGQLVILGGGTKQGKTALALQCAEGIAEAHGPVWFYSGEMSVQQLAMRSISRRSGIPLWRQRDGRISNTEWEKLADVQAVVSRLPIMVEKRRLTMEQIAATASEYQRRHGLAAVVIDHAGLVRHEGRAQDEWVRSADVTEKCKALADRLGVVVICCVQLKKNTFTVPRHETFRARLRWAINNRPTYTDLMGAVERDADHVLIPFNARPILATVEPEAGGDDHVEWTAKMEEHSRKAEIILALSREQQFPARRDVIWNGETTSFERTHENRPAGMFPY